MVVHPYLERSHTRQGTAHHTGSALSAAYCEVLGKLITGVNVTPPHHYSVEPASLSVLTLVLTLRRVRERVHGQRVRPRVRVDHVVLLHR